MAKILKTSLKISSFIFLAPLMTFGLNIAPSRAQISQAIVQEIIDGKQVYIEDVQAKVDDQAEFGQVILTKKSRAGLLFNNGAAGRLSQNASVTVGQCVELEQGQLLVSGPVNGCMAGVSVAVTGTVYVMERNDQEKSGQIKVLEGAVLVSDSEKPDQTTQVKAGEKLNVLEGIIGSVIPMTPEELLSILNGSLFNGFRVPITPDSALQSMCSNLLPGLSCSTGGASYSPPMIPSLPISIPIPGIRF
jgi:hypothetical protein